MKQDELRKQLDKLTVLINEKEQWLELYQHPMFQKMESALRSLEHKALIELGNSEQDKLRDNQIFYQAISLIRITLITQGTKAELENLYFRKQMTEEDIEQLENSEFSEPIHTGGAL